VFYRVFHDTYFGRPGPGKLLAGAPQNGPLADVSLSSVDIDLATRSR
jgi:hypothetical protein